MPSLRIPREFSNANLGPPAYIGDEVSAAGYRLGGAEAFTPAEEELPALFERLRKSHALILLSVEMARQLPTDELNEAMLALRPLVMVVPDVRNRFPVRDLISRLRSTLGMRI